MNTCRKIDLSGQWEFTLRADLSIPDFEEKILKGTLELTDRIPLPSTISQQKKSPLTKERSTGYLTDPYAFRGYGIYSREICFSPNPSCDLFLILEKTRVSTLYVNSKKVGSQNSLCTPHVYDITESVSGDVQQVTLIIDNVSCPVAGGHMTSPDTQTDWLGILGEIALVELPKKRASQIQLYPCVKNRELLVTGRLLGCRELPATVSIEELTRDSAVPGEGLDSTHTPATPLRVVLRAREDGQFSLQIPLPDARLWSEHDPACYRMILSYNGHRDEIPFGLREFSARDGSLFINDTRIFLRGKHDGMLFPLTGVAPTDVPSWLKVMGTAKEYGINHYRFHTCCPPEAAFYAADLLGIYLSPELPFWGTVEEETSPAREYLILEGLRILDRYGNHPSFFGLSLGNELWGSKEVLDTILAKYKKHDSRHLYTQGSNNFQFAPAILEHEDYFVGVRFSRDRLFRGSYAMCDAPLGHIQTKAPCSDYTYDELIRPGSALTRSGEGTPDGKSPRTMEIQYGTGVKTVTLTDSEELIPQVPVISHEIGQYFMYPDYRDLPKYTGVLKPFNLEIFRRRLEAAGLGHLAESYFRASGHFAADCYKMELETALRSGELSGFQLLDLQDFPGQGTALVGILNSFMESKGILDSVEWREFCNDRVLLGCLGTFVHAAGSTLTMPIKYYTYTGKPEEKFQVNVSVWEGETLLSATQITSCSKMQDGVYEIGNVRLPLPPSDHPHKLILRLEREDCPEIHNHYPIWVYPEKCALYLTGEERFSPSGGPAAAEGRETLSPNNHPAAGKDAEASGHLLVTHSWTQACRELSLGNRVLFLPRIAAPQNPPGKDTPERFVTGTYCTDFWNYPMFRSISEAMSKPWPVGTLGILVDPSHPAFAAFPTEYYTTPQWYDIVTAAPATVLDGTGLEPIVRTIDNCERNHNMGILWEARVGTGSLLVCTSPLDLSPDSLPCRQLLKSLLQYASSDRFAPNVEADVTWLDELFHVQA